MMNAMIGAGSRSRRLVGLGLIALSVGAAACKGALPDPKGDGGSGQMMLDMADALSAMREQSASLQEQVDSLRDALARQDTVLRQLAAASGVPMKP